MNESPHPEVHQSSGKLTVRVVDVALGRGSVVPTVLARELVGDDHPTIGLPEPPPERLPLLCHTRTGYPRDSDRVVEPLSKTGRDQVYFTTVEPLVLKSLYSRLANHLHTVFHRTPPPEYTAV